jgi:hypothetical protein
MTKGAKSLLAAAIVSGLLITAGATHAATLAQPFPDAVAGWTRTDDVRSFDAPNLYQYIDGDAEKYVKAGVRTTSTADYSFRGQVDAVADVYTMTDASGARTIFESDAVGNARTVSLGDAAHADSQSLVFRKGAYLVRIVAYQEGPDVPQALLDLGHAIEQQLGK